jgi:hypothetical protein
VYGSSAISSQGKYCFFSFTWKYYLQLSPFSTPISCETYSGRATSIATILLGSILYTWLKHKEQEEADARKQDSSSSSQSNDREYQILPRDDGEDIEMGVTEKNEDSTIKSSVE